jgi:hypothetical protein
MASALLISEAQITAPARAMQAAAEFAWQKQTLLWRRRNLDCATIQTSISLLVRAIFDTIYDSIVVLAMPFLGIKDPGSLSVDRVPHLRFSISTLYPISLDFIRMAQILVIQRAVLPVDQGETPQVANMLMSCDVLLIYQYAAPSFGLS